MTDTMQLPPPMLCVHGRALVPLVHRAGMAEETASYLAQTAVLTCALHEDNWPSSGTPRAWYESPEPSQEGVNPNESRTILASINAQLEQLQYWGHEVTAIRDHRTGVLTVASEGEL